MKPRIIKLSSYKPIDTNKPFKCGDYKNVTFRKIISDFWKDLNETVEKYNNDIDTDVDERTIRIIYALKKIESWKSNLFILYLYYGKPSILAKKMNAKVASLSAILTPIRKEIKKLIGDDVC